jgi:hypothetical protein
MESNVNADSVFYYQVQSIGTGIDASEVRTLFNGFIVLTLEPLVTSGKVMSIVSSINGMDNDDFDTINLNNGGSRSGFPLPTHNMVSCRSAWNGPGTRRSRHYLPLGGVDDVAATSAMASAFVIALEESLWVLGVPLEGSAGVLVPVTVSPAFKLGEVPTVSEVVVGEWEFSTAFSSLDSRRTEPFWFPTDPPPE